MPATNEVSVRESHEPWEKIKLFFGCDHNDGREDWSQQATCIIQWTKLCAKQAAWECVAVQKTEKQKKLDRFHVKIRFHEYMVFDLSQI